MKTLLQINSVCNSGSTGRIAEGIGNVAIKNGWTSYIAYGRYANPSKSKTIKIGSKLDNYIQVFNTRVFDRHGYNSKRATKKLIEQINDIKPDIIHLHNIHGYYLNMELLFNFLSSINIPVVWTLHDCWAYTGHCTHYAFVQCDKWKTHCGKCPEIHVYPKSYMDNSFKNFDLKKRLFNSIKDLNLIPVSRWLENETKQSFLSGNKITQIYNGVDIKTFNPKDPSKIKIDRRIAGKFIILGAAGTWSKRKGIDDFVVLSKLLEKDEIIILVGISKAQKKELPENIIGITKTESVDELSLYYNLSDVFVNLTWEDSFSMTNLEALACGTPVVTYKTGGAVETIEDSVTGYIVQQGNIDEVKKMIQKIKHKGKEYFSQECRQRAVKCFNKEDRFKEYIRLYERLLR